MRPANNKREESLPFEYKMARSLSFGNFFLCSIRFGNRKHTHTRNEAKQKPTLRRRRLLQAHAAKWTERRRKKFPE